MRARLAPLARDLEGCVVNHNKEPTMTTDHIFPRSLAALSAIVTVATGVALTAAPSTARAETGDQIIMSDGRIHCPPCGFLKVYDQDGLSFRDVVAEVQNGNQIVITAAVTVAGTAGKARTGSVVLSAFMDDSDDASFMDYTDDACMPSLMSRQAGEQACAAVSRALSDAFASARTAADVLTAPPSTPDTGIIMRDGGICDPIRHMGC
jgi:hypothetical protein